MLKLTPTWCGPLTTPEVLNLTPEFLQCTKKQWWHHQWGTWDICLPVGGSFPHLPPSQKKKWPKSAIFGKLVDFCPLRNAFCPLDAPTKKIMVPPLVGRLKMIPLYCVFWSMLISGMVWVSPTQVLWISVTFLCSEGVLSTKVYPKTSCWNGSQNQPPGIMILYCTIRHL